jgi:twitching motility protein PilU
MRRKVKGNPACSTRAGMVLLSGATGSGKSTSLASLIDYRNTNSAGHIITITVPGRQD